MTNIHVSAFLIRFLPQVPACRHGFFDYSCQVRPTFWNYQWNQKIHRFDMYSLHNHSKSHQDNVCISYLFINHLLDMPITVYASLPSLGFPIHSVFVLICWFLVGWILLRPQLSLEKQNNFISHRFRSISDKLGAFIVFLYCSWSST